MPWPFDARAAYPRWYRQLLWAVAPTSQSGFCVYDRSSNAPHRTVKTVRPFAAVSSPLLWPRLTSAVTSRLLSKSLARKHRRRSLRVKRVTFLPRARRIYADWFRMTWGFESIGPLAHQVVASYAVRVPRARSLPAASFRFAVAHDTLAVRLEVPVIKASIGTLTRQVTSSIAFAYQLSSVRS